MSTGTRDVRQALEAARRRLAAAQAPASVAAEPALTAD
ncbi:hypothetical protein SAM23877_0895 [Streptomyces ambofaciens ATCC 23877]|uniref:Uncharacterized protein n=1 Tax=Streptomyces ambofaciens (strain ATCC 23877 / 3486 / DSM 40053 / JCM 4204 / NBRC 12836 / NRRL B-2516) TaxID=278992 RepID=A0A0K2ALR2_STRA7|nr:hypothetical protein SAM23877_0895 [Streptomyces ambofaciens ATCC 23877]